MSLEDCENRGASLDGKKCFCKPWERWTNCLEVGHCVRDGCTTDQDQPNDESEIEE